MAGDEEKATHRFSLKTLMLFITEMAICFSFPDNFVFPMGVVTFVIAGGLYVDRTDKVAMMAFMAWIALVIRAFSVVFIRVASTT